MKKIILIAIIFFTYQIDGKSQSNFTPELETGIGVVYRVNQNFSAVRLALGTKNLLLKNRLGFYYVIEHRGGKSYLEKNENVYFRDIFGAIYSVNKNFAVRAGLGLFSKGILADNGGLRKEIAVSYQLPKYPLSVEIGYSLSIGPTTTFRYLIPMKAKKLDNLHTAVNSIIDVPVEKVELPKSNEPIKVAEPKVEPKVEPKDEPKVEPKMPEDLNLLAKKSTTYYPFNADTLSTLNKQNLTNIIQYLKENPKSKVSVIGGADLIGSEDYNRKLSLSRAEKVKEYMIKQGIEADRIVALSSTNKGTSMKEEDRALDRNSKFVLSAE